MHLHILPDHQKLFFNKDIFDRLEWLKTCFDYFQTTRNFFSKKIFFDRLEWLKTYFDAFILPDRQKLFFKKDIFDRLEWLKTCFDAFAHTSRPPENFFQKRNFCPSGVDKNVFGCIFAFYQTTRIMAWKKLLFNIWSG